MTAEADALRMERDAAHEECARLTAGWDEVLSDCNRAFFYWGQGVSVANRLVRVICDDAERITTLTAERDRARDIAVALEQQAAGIVDAVLALTPDESGRVSKGLVLAFLRGELDPYSDRTPGGGRGWVVFRSGDRPGEWVAAPHGSWVEAEYFPTHAEALAYALAQAEAGR